MNINKWRINSQFWLMPGVCVVCGDRSRRPRDLCAACESLLLPLGPACARCAQSLPPNTRDDLCGRCLHSPPAYYQTLSCFQYAHPLDTLLQALKYRGRLENARVLAALMADWVRERLDVVPELLVPVPLHAMRQRERGFNQAVELARPIARQLAIPLENGLCRRARVTDSQSGLSRKARMRNVKGAFELNGKVSGHVAIVDDVMTTGSTVNELAKVLVRAGADRVDIWVCARA